MIAIGNVKLGMRIEPIYVHELSREEVKSILEEQGIAFGEDVEYPIDTRLLSTFRTDRQKLGEYIEICKYASNKRKGINTKKPNAKELSIFDDDLQINYELGHMKESESMSDSEKIDIYRNAKATQTLFKMFGANNINLEINLLDRAYFTVQSLIHNIRNRKKVQALPSGESKMQTEFRKELFDGRAQKATEKVSEMWKEQPVVVTKESSIRGEEKS